MPITYKWGVVQMDTYPKYEGRSDVVFTVHWTLDATDGEHTVGVYGSVGLTLDPKATHAPYASLTQAQVIDWVHEALGEEQVAACEASVAQQLKDQIAPPVVTPALPWSE